jgi:hypothetical protein
MTIGGNPISTAEPGEVALETQSLRRRIQLLIEILCPPLLTLLELLGGLAAPRPCGLAPAADQLVLE